MLSKEHNSSYTISVDLLVNAICGDNHNAESLYSQATEYFANEPANRKKLAELKSSIQEAELAKQSESGKQAVMLEQRIALLGKKYTDERLKQKKSRLLRLNKAVDICLDILCLTEGDDFDDTQLKSAKFLTTLVLFSPQKDKKLAELHYRLKPAYKAVLSLRLLDKLMIDGTVKNSYMIKNYNSETRYEPETITYECYTQSVILPIMLAAIFQDVGLQHPELTELLEGTEEEEKDRFRLLDKNERDEMLRLNYQHTVDYLKNGLGCQESTDDTREAIAVFNEAEQRRLKFQLGLVLDANSSKLGTSEIIKIPQIYASVVFSTKRDYQRKNLPTASILISQLALKKAISPPIAKVFVDIVGQFPLGYGVVYIPTDIRGYELELYEYAIVSGLNPQKLDEPICRLVTKNLIFLPYGKTTVVERERNLHFPAARKKLVKIDPKRLAEIMQKLSHDYRVEESNALIPNFWEPHRYFCLEGNQNLWSS